MFIDHWAITVCWHSLAMAIRVTVVALSQHDMPAALLWHLDLGHARKWNQQGASQNMHLIWSKCINDTVIWRNKSPLVDLPDKWLLLILLGSGLLPRLKFICIIFKYYVFLISSRVGNQGSLLSPKIEFFIKGDMRGLSFFSGGHL